MITNRIRFIQLLLPMVLCICWGCASSQDPTYTTDTKTKEKQPQKVRTSEAIPTTNPKEAATTPNVSAVKQVYYGVNQEHSIALVMDYGKKFKLEDGSIWEIQPSYYSQATMWPVAQRIKVTRAPFDRYPFRFTVIDNQNTVVDARLISSPY